MLKLGYRIIIKRLEHVEIIYAVFFFYLNLVIVRKKTEIKFVLLKHSFTPL